MASLVDLQRIMDMHVCKCDKKPVIMDVLDIYFRTV
jgi:hypothetical protein